MCGLLLQVSGVQRLIILPIRASIATATAVVVFRTSDSMASMTVSAIAVLALFGAVANARVIPPGQGMRARLSDKSILFFSARHDRPYAPDLSLSLSLTHTHTQHAKKRKKTHNCLGRSSLVPSKQEAASETATLPLTEMTSSASVRI